jgi:hypothetical protein
MPVVAGVGESDAGGGRSGVHARLDQLETDSLRSTLLNVEMAGSQEDAYVRVISGGHGVGAASRRG